MENEFVSFRTVKQAVSMEAALAHYGVKLRRAGAISLRGACPLPSHSSKSSRQSFAVNTAQGVWACHSASCALARGGRRGGSVLDFVAAMEGCSIHQAALRLQERFLTTPHTVLVTTGSAVRIASSLGSGDIISCRDDSWPANAPLSFVLRGVDTSHSYLVRCGVSRKTAEYFGIGFYGGRGCMSGRVVIPIHDERGDLVAYAGRAIDGSLPKYKLPATFKKSRVLFNLHRALASGSERVVVVEGFFDCAKVHQAGFPSVVALMGSWLSSAQESLIVENFREVVLMLDGDEAGRAASQQTAARLAHHILTRIAGVPTGRQPDDLSSNEIYHILESANHD